MRFLANENFPGPVVQALRALGEEVAWVAEDMRAASDEAVLARAQAEGRVLVTFDKDFGELAFRSGLPASSGVVLFRLGGSSPGEDNARALAVLLERRDWPGNFTVVHDDRIRMRELPRERRSQ